MELHGSGATVAVPRAHATLHKRLLHGTGLGTPEGFFVHKRQVYIVMDRYACDALAWTSSQLQPSSPEGALHRLRCGLALFRETLWCLARMHARGWMHRDMKPANILLRHGTPRDSATLHSQIARSSTGAISSGVAPCAGVHLTDFGLAAHSGVGPGTGSAERLSAASHALSDVWGGSGVALALRAETSTSLGDARHSLAGAMEELESDEWCPPSAATSPAASAAVPGSALSPASEARVRRGRRQSAQAGTLFYRAPELLFGAMRHGSACDVWAAGMTGWELLVGCQGGEPLATADGGMGQIAALARILGPASADVWPSKAACAPYMAGPEELEAAAETAREAQSAIDSGAATPPAPPWWSPLPQSADDRALPAPARERAALVQGRLAAMILGALRPADPGPEAASEPGGPTVKRLPAFPGSGASGPAEAAARPPAGRPCSLAAGRQSGREEQSRLEALADSCAHLLARMLCYDPDLRPSAAACLRHPCMLHAAPLGDVALPVPAPMVPGHIARAEAVAARKRLASGEGGRTPTGLFLGAVWDLLADHDRGDAAAAAAGAGGAALAVAATDDDDCDNGAEVEERHDDHDRRRASKPAQAGGSSSLRLGTEPAPPSGRSSSWHRAAGFPRSLPGSAAAGAASSRPSLVPPPWTAGSPAWQTVRTHEAVPAGWNGSPGASAIRQLGRFGSSPLEGDEPVPARLQFDAAAASPQG